MGQFAETNREILREIEMAQELLLNLRATFAGSIQGGNSPISESEIEDVQRNCANIVGIIMGVGNATKVPNPYK